MPKYIDAEPYKDCKIVLHDEDKGAWVKDIPTADVQEVKHGKWIMSSDRPDTIICSVCSVGYDVWKHEAKDFKYCPNCGARMDKE